MSERETRFTKIKYDGAKVRLEYEVTRPEGDPDEFTLFSVDAPNPSFVTALEALVPDVVEICELEPHQAAQIDIRGVTLTWTHDILGACVTALKRLTTANAPLVLNTPHLPSSPYSANNENEPTLPPGMAERLHVVMAEAQKYVNGDRAQGHLFASAQTTAA